LETPDTLSYLKGRQLSSCSSRSSYNTGAPKYAPISLPPPLQVHNEQVHVHKLTQLILTVGRFSIVMPEKIKLQKFVDELPIPNTLSPKKRSNNSSYYEVTMKEFSK
jgi:hypothetical protein